jgi:SAM-dependent methyltransferase
VSHLVNGVDRRGGRCTANSLVDVQIERSAEQSGLASAGMDLSERGANASRHPWEIERFRAYRRILADHGALAARRVLDVGAGDGWFAENLLDDLPPDVEVVCWDINYRQPELDHDDPRIVRTDVAPDPGFDLLLLLDVLEHVDDPSGFLAGQVARLAAPGTKVLVAVPAHQVLFSDHDRALGHHRRYSPDVLLAELTPWIRVLDRGSIFSSLLAPRTLAVVAERIRRRSGPTPSKQHGVGRWQGGPLVTQAVRSALAADVAVGRRLRRSGVRLPGLSTWVYGVVV